MVGYIQNSFLIVISNLADILAKKFRETYIFFG